jgi:hypothetical protein
MGETAEYAFVAHLKASQSAPGVLVLAHDPSVLSGTMLLETAVSGRSSSENGEWRDKADLLSHREVEILHYLSKHDAPEDAVAQTQPSVAILGHLCERACRWRLLCRRWARHS